MKQYAKLLAFLKRNAKGYRPKKVKVLTPFDIIRFLQNANDDTYLWMKVPYTYRTMSNLLWTYFYYFFKVALIIGVVGSCTSHDLTNLVDRNVIDEGLFLRIRIPNAKTKIFREFVITPGDIDGLNLVEIVKRYAELRPERCMQDRFFLACRGGKCSRQPIGINAIGSVPAVVAQFLNLPDPNDYTGHSFRKSSLTYPVLLTGNRRYVGRQRRLLPKEAIEHIELPFKIEEQL